MLFVAHIINTTNVNIISRPCITDKSQCVILYITSIEEGTAC